MIQFKLNKSRQQGSSSGKRIFANCSACFFQVIISPNRPICLTNCRQGPTGHGFPLVICWELCTVVSIQLPKKEKIPVICQKNHTVNFALK